MKKITNILLDFCRLLLCLICLMIFIFDTFKTTNSFLHYYDNVFDDKDNISYVVESYQKEGTLDVSNTDDYTIDYKKYTIAITCKTCKALMSLDENKNVTNIKYELTKLPVATYILAFLLDFFLVYFFMDKFKDNFTLILEKIAISKKS